jgi:hypothetical protein
MDCTDFLSKLERTDGVPTRAEATPVAYDKDYVIMAGWKFNIKSTIFSSAKADEVINGWTLLCKKINADDSNKLFAAVFTLPFQSIK